MEASQNTALMSFASRTISPIASKGPTKPPTVSSDFLRPKARPRMSGGVTAATRASRGAVRTPLPIRSTPLASSTPSTEAARGKVGLDRAASP